MEEVIRRCDFKIGTKGRVCGETVPDNEPTPINGDYSADLCGRHREGYNAAVAPYLDVAVKVSTTRKGHHVRRSLSGRSGQPFTTADVREWMRSQGREVSDSGRLPNDVIEEYKDTVGV